MPLIQTLFYFAGFVAFALAALCSAVLLLITLKNYRRVRELLNTFEDKMNAPLITALMPFLPTLIALFGEFKRGRKRN